MNLKHLKTFLCVAEQAHITRAARLLHLPQAAVSHHLGVLEHHVGTPLLWRSHDGAVQLTEAGLTLLDDVRLLVGLGDLAIQRARDAAEAVAPPSSPVRLGAVPAALMDTVPLALEACAERHQGMAVQVSEGQSESLAQALHEGRLDLVLSHLPVEPTPGLTVRVLGAIKVSAVMWADHPLAARASVSAQELAHHRLLVPSGQGATEFHAQIHRLCTAHGGADIEVFDGPMDAVFDRVRARQGVALLPDSMRQISLRGIVHRPLVGAPLALTLAVAWRESETRPEVLALAALLVSLGEQRKRLARWLERA